MKRLGLVLVATLLIALPAAAQVVICGTGTGAGEWTSACPSPTNPFPTLTATGSCPAVGMAGSVVSVNCADAGTQNPYVCNYDNPLGFPYTTYHPLNSCTYRGGAPGAGQCAATGIWSKQGSGYLLENAGSYCQPDETAYPSLLDLNTWWMSPGSAGGLVESPESIATSSAATHWHSADVTLPATLGAVSLVRDFTSDPQNGSLYSTLNSTSDTFLPKPFGSNPSNSSAFNWTHNFYSFVAPQSWMPSAMSWRVRATSGDLLEFQACPDGGSPWTNACSAPPNPYAATTTSQLVWNGTAANSFTLISKEGTRYVYGAEWTGADGGTPHYFLTKVQDRAYTNSGGPRVTATVNYAAPTGLSCPGVGAGGVPFISNIQTIDGAQINFHYKVLPAYHGAAATECVLDYVGVWDRGSSTEYPYIRYTYATDAGVESEGLIAQATWDAGRYDTFTYPTAGASTFSYSTVGTQTSSQPWNTSFQATSLTNLHDSASLATSSSSCGTDYSSSYCYAAGTSTWTYSTRYTGGHTNTQLNSGQYTRSYLGESTNFSTGVQTHHEVDTCSASTCGPGVGGASGTTTTDWEWTRAGGLTQAGQATPKGVQDPNGQWTANASNAPASGPPQETEIQTTYRGATDYNGSNALEQHNYHYTYGATNQEQLITLKTEASTIGPNTDGGTETQYTYTGSGNDFLSKIVKHGWTETFTASPWPVTDRYIGTFFFQNQPCTGGGYDSLGRTVEVHGPCLVSGFNATDCDSGGIVPVKQFNYYTSSGSNGNAANRLYQTLDYTTNSGTSCMGANSVTTTYNSYDALGNPTSVTDPAGVSASYTYQEHLLTSKTIGTQIWKYTYDNKQLTSVQNPTSVNSPNSGLYEVYCYRTGTTPWGGCTASSGNWTDRLQWKAKYSSTSSISSWSEAILYAYWNDGTLKSESYEYNNGSGNEKRRYKEYHADAKLHPTFEQWGDGIGNGGFGTYYTPSGFDPVGNKTGAGIPWNPYEDWCQHSTSAQSTYCNQLKYSRANRLGMVSQYLSPTGSGGSAVNTCVDHDVQGNINQVCLGESSACGGLDGGLSSCSHPALVYKYDDFGNMVEGDLPWTNPGANQQQTNFEYDAMGNVVKKQTPNLRDSGEYILYNYDSMGRLYQGIHYYSNYTQFEGLFYLAYDTLTASTTIKYPQYYSCPALSNTGGRLAARGDNFGITWYSYDALGQVVEEVRARSTGSGSYATCGSTMPLGSSNPHTLYTYNADEVLTSITYPLGAPANGMNPSQKRQVTYTVNAIDRVSGVSVGIWNGSAWTSTQVLQNVLWEPYEGLRGYQMIHPQASSGSNVSTLEYVLGGSAGTPGTGNCPGLPTPSQNDQTGRVNHVWVSTGAQSPWSGPGDIYTHEYTWVADQITQTTTCYFGNTPSQMETFNYDGLLRLSTANMTPVPSNADGGAPPSTGGAFTNLAYGYDSRSNRNSYSDGRTSWNVTAGASPHVDWTTLLGSNTSGHLLSYAYTYEDDGRVWQKTWPNDSTGGPVYQQVMAYEGLGLATESIFHSISLNGATYNYYIDAFGRRRAKVYPTNSATDEYFDDTGHQLLSDQGNNTMMSSPTAFPLDEYVWLGGRPVVVIRGQLSTSWSRNSDWTSNCQRNGDVGPGGDTSACGVYFPITDVIGKPLIILDSYRRITGVGEYQPNGQVNRVPLDVESQHPYPQTTQTVTLGDFMEGAANTGLQTDTAFIYDMLDTYWDSHCNGDYGSVYDGQTGTLLESPIAGPHRGGYLWSHWYTGHQRLKFTFTTNATRYSWNGMSCVNSGNNTGYDGFILPAYQYRKYQSGATPYWIPLRYPGQYYDAETDLVENWNRYYDPALGRYLEPDPEFARNPDLVAAIAARGYGINPYAYASNNPIRVTDPTGRVAGVDDVVEFSGAAVVAAYAAGAVITGIGAVVALFNTDAGQWLKDVGSSIGNWASQTASSIGNWLWPSSNTPLCSTCSPPSDGHGFQGSPDVAHWVVAYGVGGAAGSPPFGVTTGFGDDVVGSTFAMAKGGKQNIDNEYTRMARMQPDPCAWLSDQYDNADSASERLKIQQAQKAMGCRNKQKRG